MLLFVAAVSLSLQFDHHHHDNAAASPQSVELSHLTSCDLCGGSHPYITAAVFFVCLFIFLKLPGNQMSHFVVVLFLFFYYSLSFQI